MSYTLINENSVDEIIERTIMNPDQLFHPRIEHGDDASTEEFNVPNIYFFEMGPRDMILLIKYPAKLYFKGVLLVECVSGFTDIHGHTLSPYKPGPHLVLSGYGQSAICLSPISFSNTTDQELEDVLIKKGIQEGLRQKILAVGSSLSVLILSKPPDDLPVFNLFKLEKLFPLDETQKKVRNYSLFHKPEEWFSCKFDILSGKHIQPKMKYHHRLLKLANGLVNEEDDARVMVCGGKGVGKSTALQFLINKMLDKWISVYVIDFDPGQPEFTIAGCVSITEITKPVLGPNHTNFQKPLRSVNLGHVDPDSCLTEYFKAIQEFCKYCNQVIFKECMPLFINTMGYIKGFGLEIIAEIICSFRPTHVLQINSAIEPNLNGIPLTFGNISDLLKGPSALRRVLHRYKLVTISHQLKKKLVIYPRIIREIKVVAYMFLTSEDSKLFIREVSVQHRSEVEITTFFKTDKVIAVCLPGNDTNISECIGFGIVLEERDGRVVFVTPLSDEDVGSHFDIFGLELGLQDVLWNKVNLFKKEMSEDKVIILGHSSNLSLPFLF